MDDSHSLDSMSESDFREEVLAPIIRRLGYKRGTENDVRREVSLVYPRVSLGRRNPSSDPRFPRGRVDYLLRVGDRLQWVLEAKAPSSELTQLDREQTYSYAIHHEVGAVQFCLTNGHRYEFFSTSDFPTNDPIMVLTASDIDADFTALETLASPSSLLRRYPDAGLSLGEPLASSLSSFARITSGRIEPRLTGAAGQNPELLITFIEGGSVQRSENGGLTCYLETRTGLKSLNELSQRLGSNRLVLSSDSQTLSTEPAQPTVFRARSVTHFAKGESLPDFRSGQSHILPHNMDCTMTASASGSLSERRFRGTFSASYDFVGEPPLSRVETVGDFEVALQ